MVFINDKDAEKFGGFPLPRDVLAKGIETIASQQPRGIILKLFIDQPKVGTGDQDLASAITKAPVVLQARIDDGEPNPNPMPERFCVSGLPDSLDVAVTGRSGWLPLPSLSSNAHDIGFVDVVSPQSVPIVERYQDQYVKSLYVCALEMAFQEKAVIQPSELRIGRGTIDLDEQLQAGVQFPQRDDLTCINFRALLDGTLEAGDFKDKVIILGYDGSKIHTLETPIGNLNAHRVFCYALFDLHSKLLKQSH